MNRTLWILLFLLIDCSPKILVHTDFDSDIDIRKFHCYSWADKESGPRNNPLYYDELNDKRIKDAVNKQLEIKGLFFVEQKPELILHYHIILEEKSVIESDPYGYYNRPYWQRSQIYSYEYKQGTLIIDMMDSQSKNLVWRGLAVSILDNQFYISEKFIKEAVSRIFCEYSPALTVTYPCI